MKRATNTNSAQITSALKAVMIQSLFITTLTLSIYSCKKSSDDQVTTSQKVAQIVYTSDLHYGISRTFRGVTTDAATVNQALVQQINALPVATFPNDGGVNAEKKISTIDYLIITGDISSREQTGPPQIQSSAASWGQFENSYLSGITLKNAYHQSSVIVMSGGNHDVSNAIGYYNAMLPEKDPTTMVNIYNMMLKPTTYKTNASYDYTTDKINYSRDIVGVHLMFVTIWPDSAARVWMANDLSKVSSTTPVIIFTHDQPDIETNHLTNPNGTHTINSTDKFENIVAEVCKDGITISAPTTIEQKAFVSFLQAHQNIKAYFHGNENKNEFYVYKGPDNNISLKVFRVDSPMKGLVSGSDAPDGIGDEKKLSFQVIAIDGATKTMTVRECLWNTTGATSLLVWGANSTISLN